MKNVAKFEKVSFNEFERSVLDIDFWKSYHKIYNLESLKELYDKIIIPARSTKRSAGYDFYFPLWDIALSPGTSVKIPTGIKVDIHEEDWFLGLFTKSGLSQEYHTRLIDTISVIDADYYGTKNEGHIFAEITNGSNKVLNLKNGMKYIQGIFIEYGLVDGDNVTTEREGGYGSTSDPI